jgi:hypothetical protein
MLRNIIIFLLIFLLILWLQYNDDVKFKNKEKRKSLYDNIKIPLFVGCIVLLIKDLDYKECFNEIQSLFIIPNDVSLPDLPIESHHDILNDVFTEQPDF